MTNNSRPHISVIMPVYNAQKFLRESIDSILRQSYSNFELIIINDGSSDDSQDIIDEYSKRDNRIITYKQKNRGVVYTANKAIGLSRGEYIARMDADDISMPDRLKEQVKVLDSHPHTVLVCSSFEVFDEDGEFQYRDIVPPDNESLKLSLYLRNPIANGSTLVRKSALEEVGLFDDVFAEDFHTWMKLAPLGDFEGTGTTLYRWRMNPRGLTLSNNDLSLSKSRQYIENLWMESPPLNVPRTFVRLKSKEYLDKYGRKGVQYKEVFLTDLSQFAAKLFVRGHYLRGMRQLFTVASSGRMGLKIALQRIHFIGKGHYAKARKLIPFGRGSYDKSF